MNEINNEFPTYHKIQSVFKRDMALPKKPLIIGDFTLPEFEYLCRTEWEFTEKVDGTNVRVHWNGDSFRFGGRTDNAQMPMPLLESLAGAFNDETASGEFFKGCSSMTIFGEGYGGKIQSGGKYSDVQTFVVFDILVGNWWLKRSDVEDICGKIGLRVVPTVYSGPLYQGVGLVRDGLQSKWGPFIAEGIVGRPKVELRARNGKRIITKIKSCDFNSAHFREIK